MRKYININLLILGILLAASGLAPGQQFEGSMQPFDFDVVAFPGKTLERVNVDIYAWVRNSQLQFLRNDSAYYANYQINLGIFDNADAAILTRDTTMTIVEKDYAATIDKEVERIYHFQYDMLPDEYQFKIRLFDMNSGAKREQTIKRKIQPFTQDQFQLSDVIILDSNELDSLTDKNVLPPLRIDVREKIYVYAEVVYPDSIDTYEIEAKILQQGKSKQFVFKRDVSTTTWPSRILLELTNDNMLRGVSQLSVEAKTGELETRVLKTVRFFQSFGKGEFMAGGSLDEMVDQLEYVARGDEWKQLRDSRDARREALFKEFWGKRDPTPDTPDNELFDEYYKRVNMANQRFGSNKRDGWITDRGRVFIVFGAPDTIERTKPFRSSFAAYEVWYYEELRERFVFVDEYGFGEYRMVSGNIY